MRNNNYSSYNRYQYETSPRKLEPEYAPVKNPYKKRKTTARKIDPEKEREKAKKSEFPVFF